MLFVQWKNLLIRQITSSVWRYEGRRSEAFWCIYTRVDRLLWKFGIVQPILLRIVARCIKTGSRPKLSNNGYNGSASCDLFNCVAVWQAYSSRNRISNFVVGMLVSEKAPVESNRRWHSRSRAECDASQRGGSVTLFTWRGRQHVSIPFHPMPSLATSHPVSDPLESHFTSGRPF